MLKGWKIKSRNRIAVVQRWSVQKVFLEENSQQENTCQSIFFFCRPQAFSYRTFPVAASDAMQYSVYLHKIVAVDSHHALIPLSVATSLSWHSEHLKRSLSVENSLRTVVFIIS